MLVPLTLVPDAIGNALKFPVTTGGDASSVLARRKEETTVSPSGQAARRSGPTMSSAREIPPQPPAAVSGKVIWPMKSVVGFSGRAIPNANWVLAPKKRWNWIPVAGSVKAVVVCAVVGVRMLKRVRARSNGDVVEETMM